MNRALTNMNKIALYDHVANTIRHVYNMTILSCILKLHGEYNTSETWCLSINHALKQVR